MKVAVTTSEPGLDAPVDPRFAAAPYIALVDLEDMDYRLFENPAAKPGAGHGIIAARFVARLGADAVISGDFCPHSFGALRAIGTELYAAGGEATAAEAVALLQQHALAGAEPSPHHHHAHFQPRRPIPVTLQD